MHCTVLILHPHAFPCLCRADSRGSPHVPHKHSSCHRAAVLGFARMSRSMQPRIETQPADPKNASLEVAEVLQGGLAGPLSSRRGPLPEHPQAMDHSWTPTGSRASSLLHAAKSIPSSPRRLLFFPPFLQKNTKRFHSKFFSPSVLG